MDLIAVYRALQAELPCALQANKQAVLGEPKSITLSGRQTRNGGLCVTLSSTVQAVQDALDALAAR